MERFFTLRGNAAIPSASAKATVTWKATPDPTVFDATEGHFRDADCSVIGVTVTYRPTDAEAAPSAGEVADLLELFTSAYLLIYRDGTREYGPVQLAQLAWPLHMSGAPTDTTVPGLVHGHHEPAIPAPMISFTGREVIEAEILGDADISGLAGTFDINLICQRTEA